MGNMNNDAESLSRIFWLVKQGIDQPDLGGYTPLMLAATNGYADIVEALLAKGASVDKADQSGSTPLMFAVKNGHADIVEKLLAKGADIDKADRDGYTPRRLAKDNLVIRILSEDIRKKYPEKILECIRKMPAPGML